ncbi:MAG: septum site-determining protein MinC, partial [Synergistaceae bacterium]|nr:septum site-determining protein MinC [Synergistaceae bacterium]
MKIPSLNLLRKIRKPDAQIKMERTHYGIKFCLPEKLSEDELLKLLVRIPASAYKLPEDQRVSIDFGERTCSRRLILHMMNSIIWEKGINIAAWLSGNDESVKLFRSAGLSVIEPAAEIQKANKPEDESKNEEKNEDKEEKHEEHISALKVVYNSMRSGQKVETEGDVLVLGHLNPGAEVIAGGSIIVAGRLLGVVHAGGYGRGDVFVWAGSFETPQVRIGNKLCYADSRSTSCWRKCVVITLEDGTPVIRENKFMSMFMNTEKK